jgi:hypothetical protein
MWADQEKTRMSLRVMMLLVVISMMVVGVCVGQIQAPTPTSPSLVPVVSFELNWKVADPEWCLVSIDSERRVTYRSRPHSKENEEPVGEYSTEFTATEGTTREIFEKAEAAKYFKGDFELKAKNIAQTGVKTLKYSDGNLNTSTTFNQPADPAVADVTEMFQRISATMEMGRKLTYSLRFDKLGVDGLLKRMEEMKKSGMMIEVQALEPQLTTIIKDKSFMHVSRQRAQRLLGK